MWIPSSRVGQTFQKWLIKALHGHERERYSWIDWLHFALVDIFRKLRALGIKADAKLLQIWATGLLEDETVLVSTTDVEQATGKSINDTVTKRGIKSFRQSFNIVQSARTGKMQLSAARIARSNLRMADRLWNGSSHVRREEAVYPYLGQNKVRWVLWYSLVWMLTSLNQAISAIEGFSSTILAQHSCAISSCQLSIQLFSLSFQLLPCSYNWHLSI